MLGPAAAKFFAQRDGRSKGGRSQRVAQKFADVPFPIRAVDISSIEQVRDATGRFDWSFIVRAPGGATPETIVASISKEHETFSAAFLTLDFFLRAARACTRRQTANGLTNRRQPNRRAKPAKSWGKQKIWSSMPAEPSHVWQESTDPAARSCSENFSRRSGDRPRARSFP